MKKKRMRMKENMTLLKKVEIMDNIISMKMKIMKMLWKMVSF